MKQISFFVVFFLLCVVNVFSAPIDTAVTRLIASNFYASRVQPATDRSPAPVQLAYTGKIRIPSQQDSTNCFYVYNVGGGYVIVSADDRFEPVLGYSNKGSFQPSAIPPAMIELLSGYQEEMRAILESGTSPCNSVLQRWADLYSGNQQHLRSGTPMVGPLLTTTWDQSDYYNDLCPVDSSGFSGHALTGCGATAMAQIIRYWQYPSHGIGSHSYTHNTYGVLSVDFSSATYDYTNMPNILNYNSTSSEIFQVAQLLYHCGVSIDMDYGPWSSSSSIISIATALNTYFGYSGCHVDFRSSYSDTDWVNMLKASLDALQPIIYRGTGSNSSSGHLFVCDGYDSEDYFHFNWGWEGSCDGYYLLSSLTPCGSDYSSNQMAIFGISASMPIIRPDKKSIPFFTEYGTISEARFVDILTNRLTSPVTATVTGSFQISADSLNYSSSVFVDSSGGKVYVRFVPTASEVTEYGYLLLSSDTTMDTVMLYGSSYIVRCVPPENLIVTSQDMQHIMIQWDAAVDHDERMLTWNSDDLYFNSFGGDKMQMIHRYCDTDLVKIHGKSLTAIDMYLTPSITLCKAMVYKGGSQKGSSFDPGNLVLEQNVDLGSLTVNDWNTITLTTPVEIDATQELWFGFYIEMTGGDQTILYDHNAVVGKSNVYAYHFPSGHVYWDTEWDDMAFCIKGRVKDVHSPSHYEVYRDSTLIANTSSLSWNDTVDEIKPYLYTVVSDWASGCTSSAQRYFSNVPHIDASPEALDFYTRYGLDNKVKSMVVTGNGLASNIQATVSGHFLISTDSLQFGTTASLSSQGGVLYVKYVPSSANTPFETGAIHFQSGSVSADIPLTGQCYEPCGPPENLTLSLMGNHVDMYWNAPELFSPSSYTLSWCSESPSGSAGYYSDMKLYLIHRFEPADLSDYHNMLLKKISFIPHPYATLYKLVVYKGGSYNGSTYDPGMLVVEQNVPISTLTEYEWNTIALDNPVTINANEELWYGIYVESPGGTYPIYYNNNTYTPNKGGVVKVVAPYSIDWTEFSNSRSFVMKALVEDCPRTCTHYQIERNEDWIGTTTTNDYTDYPFFNGLNHYTVWSVWDNGCKASTRGTVFVEGLCVQSGTSSTVQVCDSYVWHETNYYSSGTYYHTFLNNGCTQTDTLHLIIIPSIHSEEYISICESDLPYTYGDTVFGIGTPNLSVHHFQRVSTHGCDSIVTLTLSVNPLPSVSVTGATEFCDGGSTTLTAVGAANYVWSNTSTSSSITVAAPGNYSVTGTDANGCSNTASVPVVEHPVYSTSVNVSIEEGQTYWFYGQLLTTSGTYTHTLQSVYGCDSVIVLHLSVTVHPVVSVSRTASICHGDTYNFYGQVLTSPGTYVQTVSNASADTLVMLTLSVNPLPSVSVTGATEFCDGGSTTLTAVGAANYVWSNTSTSPSITVTSPGSYTVTGTDANGCSNVANTTVSLQAVSYSEVTVENTGPYSWNGITYSSSGDYIQTLTGSNGCDSVVILHLNILVGIADYSTALYKVFPNPTKNFVYVQLAGKSELRTAYVYDVYGQLLIQLDADDDHVEIDLTPFANGLYFIKAIGNHNQILGVKRVLKE